VYQKKPVTKRLLNPQRIDQQSTLTYTVETGSGKGAKRTGKRTSKKTEAPEYHIGGVQESSMSIHGSDSKVERMLLDILIRLERIEEKIDENVYPPESAIRPEFISKVKKARADLAAGKGKTYDSMDDFIRAISE